MSINVHLGARSYPIVIGRGLLKRAGHYLAAKNIGMDAVIVTNPKINGLYGGTLKKSLSRSGIRANTLIVPDSETSKSYRTFSGLINSIARLDKGKKPFIIAFGGGVVGDLAGFVAASYRRGIDFVQIPTTLVAQVDSAIGGKVAIDLPVAKNLLGAFYQPRIVLSDIALLKSLSPKDVKCGLAEVIKYAVISSRPFFDYIQANTASLKRLDTRSIEYVVRRCSAVKAKLVSMDEKDTKGIRAALNYGHTIGHAIESASGYSGYSHGEAIAIGMIAAARLANISGLLAGDDYKKIEKTISAAGLPLAAKRLNAKKIYEAMCHDKKFAQGKNRFILPVRIGRVIAKEDVPRSLIMDVLDEITAKGEQNVRKEFRYKRH